jgi:formylglycine-generating enzyme required for sulfatase activity
MSKSMLRSLAALTFATFCLITTPFSAQAAKVQPAKDRIVLLPLQVEENEKPLRAQIEDSIMQEVGQQYQVLSGKQVIEALRNASNKAYSGARDKDCSEIRCLKYASRDLGADIFITAHLNKAEGIYSLSLDFKNVESEQEVLGINIPCNGCKQLLAAAQSRALSDMPTSSTPTPAATSPAATSRPLAPGEIFRDCDYCPDMVVIPSGSYEMGSSESTEKDEKPKHRVVIDQPFAIGKIEITRGQFAEFVTASGYDAVGTCWLLKGNEWEESSSNNWRDPGYLQDDSHPVACISWNDAQAYTKWLSLKTGKHYQLPAESQWEYACRDGDVIEYCGSDTVDNVAWYEHNSNRSTHPAATKQSNAFGLFDMSGNAAEWMEDGYLDSYSDTPSDGDAWTGNSAKRVLRGGSWVSPRTGTRSSFRSVSAPEYRYFDSGFRVARMIP